MAETDEVQEPQIPAALVLRMTARLWRLPPDHRDAYVSRARARFDAGRCSRTDHTPALRTIHLASLRCGDDLASPPA